MSSSIHSIIQAATRPNHGQPLNILLFTTNEEYEGLLCETKHNFFALNLRNERWRNSIGIIPENYTEINQIKGNGITFDLILCLGRNKHFAECVQLSKELHLPLVLAEQDYPDKNSSGKKSGDVNIFVNQHQAQAWKFKPSEYSLINNAINEKLFKYNPDKKYTILSAINNWRKKSFSHGFSLYSKLMINSKLPTKIIGHNPGISNHVHWQEAIQEYEDAAIYLNTTLLVPQPTQVLQAMYAGCLVVSLKNCGIEDVIKHGKEGILVEESKPEQILPYLQRCPKRLKIIMAAHQKILLNHSLPQFVRGWNQIFDKAKDIIYLGNYES